MHFREKGAELELPRSDRSVTLEVRLADGTELKETLVPNDNTAIRVRSVPSEKPAAREAAPPATGKKPAGERPAPGGGKPASGLEANPYE